jgi:hypothetical protein
MLLVVVDSHSKWLDVGIVPKADTTATIAVLQRLFALHGLCRTIVSDNGTQFISFQFKQFCKEMALNISRLPRVILKAVAKLNV